LTGCATCWAANEEPRHGQIRYARHQHAGAEQEEHLLRWVLSEGNLRVTEFGRKKYELEEVFLSMVGEDNHGR
jgi:hypothetical protein